MPHRGVEVVGVQGGEAQSAFGDRGGLDVMDGARPLGDRRGQRGGPARVCLCQPERFACLISDGHGHRYGE